jgi:hypothetical protein
MDGEQPPDRRLYSVGCLNRERCDYTTLDLEVSKEGKLFFLVDSGADVSLVKSQKLLGTAEFEPGDRVRVKGVDWSILETHGSIETRIRAEGLEIPYSFQLVSHKKNRLKWGWNTGP